MYSFEEAKTASAEYFGNQLAADVFVAKYALRDSGGVYYEKTPDDMHRRLAREFARIEKGQANSLSEEEVYSWLSDNGEGFGAIIPQGSPMAGIGNPHQMMSYSNCFVIDQPHDSYGGIMHTDQEQAQLMKRRGGVGFDISTIRPHGLATSNAAKTTDGIGVFMERFSNTCREVAQNGRRGALMITIDVHHPEVMTFIKIKEDLKKVTGANISIKVSDEFMESVESGSDYEQRFPCEGAGAGSIIRQRADASEVWEALMHAAWKSAEPGILMWDTVKRMTPADAYAAFGFKSISTNPCFAAGTLIHTSDGKVPIEELVENPTQFRDRFGKYHTGFATCSGKKATIRLTNTLGEEIRCTPDHVFLCNDGEAYPASELKGRRLMPLVSKRVENDWFVAAGFIQGDGNLGRLDSTTHLGLEVNIGKDDGQQIAELFGETYDSDKQKYYLKESSYSDRLSDLGFDSAALPERTLPSTFNAWSHSDQVSFMRGLFSANGCVISGHRIAFKTTCATLAEQIRIWLSDNGMVPYITTNAAKRVEFENGEYLCQESYDVNLSQYNSIAQFSDLIGFVHDYKTQALHDLLIVRSPKIRNVISTGKVEEVYDFTISNTDHFGVVGNGYVAHNCGEIVLCANDSCRLLVLNTTKFVRNAFTSNAYFDYEAFLEAAKVAQRLMDDVVELEIEAIDKILAKIDLDPEPEHIKAIEKNLWIKIRSKAIDGRRTGTGVTGIGDSLAMLGVAYSSDDGVHVVGEIYKHLNQGCYMASVEMAEEKGAFPIYDWELEKDHPFLKMVFDSLPLAYQEKWKKFGRRNIALLTTAPVGSVSLVAGNVSSGIEPIYMMSFKRRRKINQGDQDQTPDFIDDMGDGWISYEVFHPGVQQWMDITGETDPGKSPYAGSTAMEIDWLQSVKIQAAAQKWVCHAISKTCNLPADVEIDTVKAVYMEAWKSGCKGFTIYRDGSRSGVLVANDATDENANVFPQNDAPDRGEELECEIHRTSVKGESWTVVVGLLDGKPYEVFGGLSEYVPIHSSAVNGRLLKRNFKTVPSKYDLYFKSGRSEEEQVIKDLVSEFENNNHGLATRLVSLGLRHGVAAQFMSSQLQKDHDSDFTSFGKVLSRVLKKYIPNGESAKTNKSCAECGSDDLYYQEGCVTCASCGHSKCG